MKQQVHSCVGGFLSIPFSFSSFSISKKLLYAFLLALFIFPTVYAQSPDIQPEREWIKQSDATGNYASTVASAVGPDQMPVVVGFSRNADNISRIVITKFNQTGDIVWQQEYEGVTGSIGEAPNKMEIDRNGNIYILGSVTFEEDDPDFLVLKYTSDGALAWV